MITDTRKLPGGRVEFVVLMDAREIEEAKLLAEKSYPTFSPNMRLLFAILTFDRGRTI